MAWQPANGFYRAISGEVDTFSDQRKLDYFTFKKGITDSYTIHRNYLAPHQLLMLIREDEQELFTDLIWAYRIGKHQWQI